jgi:multidrug transporter EmrE-like cation transporter
MLKGLDNRTTALAPSRKPLYMVLVCTVLAAFAQVFFKKALAQPLPAVQWNDSATILAFLLALLGNLQLIFAFTLHAGNALLLILALREGKLSVLYPIYALSYVWVNLLSIWLFQEQMNGWKLLGVALAITGVAVLGKVSETGE